MPNGTTLPPPPARGRIAGRRPPTLRAVPALPVIDLGPVLRGEDPGPAAAALDAACRSAGFFYVSGHGVPTELCRRIDEQSRALFALPEADKVAVAMARGGRAWRGWFPLGGELTSGRPDAKEGFYLGAELPEDDPRVAAGTPLHGPNLFPSSLPGLRATVLEYLDALTGLGHTVMRVMALGLGLPGSWFEDGLTADPLVLLRLFRYPPASAGSADWGVAEHTDYGLLTILLQDDAGGLEVRTADGWVAAPPIPGTFVCNLGDMLERMTGGRYRSTPHRVRNATGGDRLSIPFFFDPGWDAEVVPVPDLSGPRSTPAPARWDGSDVLAVHGTYGEYLLAKVGRVFPELGADVLP